MPRPQPSKPSYNDKRKTNNSTPLPPLLTRFTQSLSWLLQNYFLPTLNPALAPAVPSFSTMTIRPVAPLLRRYKSLLKTVSHDASLRARHAADISDALREIERWLAEARVAAHTHASEFASWLPHHRGRAGSGAIQTDDGERGEDEDNGEDDDDEVPEPTEAWALDRFCDALLEKGALVPVSRKSVNLPPHPYLLSSSPPLFNKGKPKKKFRSAPAD